MQNNLKYNGRDGAGSASVGCPLCSAPDAERLETFSTAELVDQWQRGLHLNVADAFRGVSELRLMRCPVCGLRYFVPAVSGSGRLYEMLQERDWYYMREKWEYGVAIRDIDAGASVLEIGCGRGLFLEKVIRERHAVARGLEMNAGAVVSAQSRGLPVSDDRVEDIVERESGRFDVVCVFQVLEHVRTVHGFLSQCVRALKPGGSLILTVPNQSSFVGLSKDNLLDFPPHHVTRWSPATMGYLDRLFPLTLQRRCFESLADYHLRWFLNLQLERLPWIPYVTGPIAIFTRRVLAPLLSKTGAYKLFRGHTLYCCFQKMSVETR